jgi:protein-L-isoaspartate(D-aspartate) O-methyltransferase
VNLWFPDWQAAEWTGVHLLGPRLAHAEHAGLIIGWWFTRKDICWRVRYRPDPDQHEHAQAVIGEIMRELAADNAIQRWAQTLYEPEAHAFGGPDGMRVSHTLFHTDSHHLLEHLRQSGDRHRGELGLLLACALMRGAAQDYYEQGDTWEKVAAHRPTDRLPTDTETNSVHRLLTGSATSRVCAPSWLAAFGDAGAALAELAHDGELTRGLRAVLAHHVLFAWNRAGISARAQALLAHAAATAVFHREPTPAPAALRPMGRDRPSTTVAAVNITRTTTTETTGEAERLRAGLVDYIRGRGTFRTPAIEAAFQQVPRHLFLPGVDPETAYAPQVVVTKRASDGSALSSATHPNMVASMLEQLQARPGQRVLEIGAATGINAALLAELVGPAGTVVTIEIDDDLADSARTALDAAGYQSVEVVCADGALGHPHRAPYDRIIVTAAASDIPTAWWEQLAPAGRLVVPLRLHNSGLTRSIAFDKTGTDRMVSASTQVCGFVPLRGATDTTAEPSLHLANNITLNLATEATGNTSALSQALTHPAHKQWTGIPLRHSDPVEHLDLWLATTADHFARLTLGPPTPQPPQATPTPRWAGATMHDGTATLAYLTLRPAGDHTDELGVTAHGPAAATFAARAIELLHQWHQQQPSQPTITAQPSRTPHQQRPLGTHIDKPDTTLTITW